MALYYSTFDPGTTSGTVFRYEDDSSIHIVNYDYPPEPKPDAENALAEVQLNDWPIPFITAVSPVYSGRPGRREVLDCRLSGDD